MEQQVGRYDDALGFVRRGDEKGKYDTGYGNIQTEGPPEEGAFRFRCLPPESAGYGGNIPTQDKEIRLDGKISQGHEESLQTSKTARGDSLQVSQIDNRHGKKTCNYHT
jgi:hypothetical protein